MWVKIDYATAMIKSIGVRTYTQWGSTSHGVTLNGEKIYTDAVTELERLDEQLRDTYEMPPLDAGDDMATNGYFTQGTAGEQGLIQDLVDEQIGNTLARMSNTSQEL